MPDLSQEMPDLSQEMPDLSQEMPDLSQERRNMKILKNAGIALMVTAVLIMENHGILSLAMIAAGVTAFQIGKMRGETNGR